MYAQNGTAKEQQKHNKSTAKRHACEDGMESGISGGVGYGLAVAVAVTMTMGAVGVTMGTMSV